VFYVLQMNQIKICVKTAGKTRALLNSRDSMMYSWYAVTENNEIVFLRIYNK